MDKDLIEKVNRLARKAGDAIMEIYEGEDFETEYKEDDTPLTKADMAAHNTIEEGLKNLTPDLPILSEESEQVPYSDRRSWNKFWMVDPLDGTKEFVKRNGEFTVNIALLKDNTPIFGVVYAPDLDVLYWAKDQEGAYKVDSSGNEDQITAEEEVKSPVRVAASRSHLRRKTSEAVENLRNKFDEVELVRTGSSRKICMVAEGKADLYPRLGPTMEWDTAAAQCVIAEAGGKIEALNETGKLDYNKEDLTNSHFVVFGQDEFDLDKIV